MHGIKVEHWKQRGTKNTSLQEIITTVKNKTKNN